MRIVAQILKGWGKAFGILPVSSAEKKMSQLRLDICRRCDHAKENKVLKILNGEANYENQLQCSKCGCPCLEKSLVTDQQCPVGKW